MWRRYTLRPSYGGIPRRAIAISICCNGGLLPYFTKHPVHARRPINARGETVATSGMFRRAFELRRAIVPADAFFEWKKVVADGKQPYVDCPTGWTADGLRGLVGRLPLADGT